ncbi:MAG: gliding motility-associated C-terminal domain-containing protein, partial [Bacteroidetes bacterium]|nr:gliding motility-associated C-terminal domain-containing protein [Bacteroidota bacterium]
SSGDSVTIKTSIVLIDYSENLPQLQIGKDHKIYITGSSSSLIDKINFPNLPGTSCDFADDEISLGATAQYGLPAFPENFFNESPTGMDVFDLLDTTFVFGSSGIITVPGTGTMTWSPSSYLSCTNCASPVVSPEQDIEYIVSDDLNGYGCPIKRRVRIKVEYLPQIPNVFTPNGDGQNETFFITGLPPISKLQIFNRWGTLLFQTNDYKNDWQIDVDGVYYYILTVRDKEYKGFVQVLKN